ncbi:hypothetical protein DPMN_151396 [Dreissena polymorpha]|uniref:Uncharacterized protein n=2 Tax=Dreissena polymorpha TaxID=45954 RepID=A0A9D4J6F7_DREPO|nr:hypothetical protein DPMN_151396 [Dreissena polymorpha]
MHDILVYTKAHARPSIGHVQPQPTSPVKHSSEEPTLSFEALMLGYYPHVTIQEALGAPFESSYKSVSEKVKYQSSAAGNQRGNIFDPILATGDNSMTAAKVSKKQSVAARMGKWLRRLFSCTKKPELTG